METEGTFTYNVDALDVAEYFVALDRDRDEPDVTPLKLQKLMYLAQANYLASTGHRLFNEDLEAFEHGPVVYRLWTRCGSNQIIATNAAQAPIGSGRPLERDVQEFVGRVWKRYRDFSAGQLRTLSHEQAPWADNHIPGAYRTRIPDEDVVDFFRSKVPASDRIFHDSATSIPDGFMDDWDEDEFVARMRKLAKR